MTTHSSDLCTLKKRIGQQDGKLFLLSAQVEKYRGFNEIGLEELNRTKQLLDEKAEENNKLYEHITHQKSQLRLANGKIHLLQYQLTKMKDSVLQTLSHQDSEVTESHHLHYFLLHYSKQQKVLSSLTELNDVRRQKDITYISSVTPPRPYSRSVVKKILGEAEVQRQLSPATKVIKAFPHTNVDSSTESKNNSFHDSSFTYSRLMKNQSLYSEPASQNEISNYSLNTTIEPRYLSVDQSVLKTPTLHHSGRVDAQSEGRVRRETKRSSQQEQLENKVDFSHIVLDGDCRKNINELKRNVNKGGFSIFTSPVSFRENISKIRVENEKLRQDIYRFRGKLEGMKSELSVMKRNLVK